MLNPPPGRYTVYIVNYEGGTTDDWANGSVTFESPKRQPRSVRSHGG